MNSAQLHSVCLQKDFNTNALIAEGALTEQQSIDLDEVLKGILMDEFRCSESDAEGILDSAFLGNRAVINSYIEDIAVTKIVEAELKLSDIKKQIPALKGKTFFVTPIAEVPIIR